MTPTGPLGDSRLISGEGFQERLSGEGANLLAVDGNTPES